MNEADKNLLKQWDELKALTEKLQATGDLWDDDLWTEQERARYQELIGDFGQIRFIEHMFRAIIETQAKVIEKLKGKIEYHRQAYDLDIFPNSVVITPESSVDNISARMGRHMCDQFLGYIEEAIEAGE